MVGDWPHHRLRGGNRGGCWAISFNQSMTCGAFSYLHLNHKAFCHIICLIVLVLKKDKRILVCGQHYYDLYLSIHWRAAQWLKWDFSCNFYIHWRNRQSSSTSAEFLFFFTLFRWPSNNSSSVSVCFWRDEEELLINMSGVSRGYSV